MRRLLDYLYLGSGVVSGLFLAAIGVTVIAQVAGRFLGMAVDSTELAGLCMAASTFFGLAYTFKAGGHIRVNLLLRSLSPRVRKIAEIWCVTVGTIAVAYMTWWSFDLVWYSYLYNDISPGLLAIPFWIPRLAMALGMLVLTIAFADEFVTVIRGGRPAYEETDEVDLDALAHEVDPAAPASSSDDKLGWSRG